MSSNLRQQLELLPGYLGNHLLLSISALALGLLISLPLAIGITRVRRLQGPVLAFAGVIQTIPSLALLALMVPLLRQIGFVPALIALTLYSMLPVIRNTVTGISEVDASLTEAGRALGMTDRQLLWRVELPLALPVIIAGIRTAAVWVVGMATLSTPVGATSLGNYIFSGLQTQNYTAVLVGCIAAAALALALDGAIRIFEMHARRRRKGRPTFALLSLLALGLALLILAAVLRTPTGNNDGVATPVVVIGAKTFTEQYILAQLIGERLSAAHIPSRTLDSLGSTVAFDALIAHRIGCYVEYAGTIWVNYMKRTDNPGRRAVGAGIRQWLADEHGIRNVIELGFENSYALAMSRERANALGIRSIADIALHAGELKIGSDYEFFGRPEWTALQSRYGLRFARTVSMDSTLMYKALVNGDVDVITAFSTDGRIAAFDLVVLSDPRQAFPPYDALLLIAAADDDQNSEWRERLLGALLPLRMRITDVAMRRANRHVDLEGGTIADAAALLASGVDSK